jgi:hypothetical protein
MLSLFTRHPASVGETYFEHMGMASSFSITFLYAGVVCAIHAILPFTFVKTGSAIITNLHNRMVLNRSKIPQATEDPANVPVWYAEI